MHMADSFVMEVPGLLFNEGIPHNMSVLYAYLDAPESSVIDCVAMVSSPILLSLDLDELRCLHLRSIKRNKQHT